MMSVEFHPYLSAFIDAEFKDVLFALKASLLSAAPRHKSEDKLRTLWTTPHNPNRVITCLSVRTGLDLYLSVHSFPRGSEIVMSAINIPSMAAVLRFHGLVPVTCDIELETVRMKLDHVEELVNERTVAILVAHLYGKRNDISEISQFARDRNLKLIEDCAEAFSGFKEIGHPHSDIALFSFGTIKHYTAFGGAIVKVRDEKVASAMEELYAKYPVQCTWTFLQKTVTCSLIAGVVNSPTMLNFARRLGRIGKVDFRAVFVSVVRGFSVEKLIGLIRHRPCDAQLAFLVYRLVNFSPKEYGHQTMKGEYLTSRLPRSVVHPGHKADERNYWLYPVVVDHPSEFVEQMKLRGIDAYRDTTQLQLIESGGQNAPSTGRADECSRFYPHEAKFMMDHVVYLPLSKIVPFHFLDTLAEAVVQSLKAMKQQQGRGPVVSSKL